MEIPFSRWYDAIEERRSRRLVCPEAIDQELLKVLVAVCKEFKPFTDVKAILRNKATDMIFKGVYCQLWQD